ncbi:penicillin-binding protein 2 [Patescibacteria group bacterium]|nr:penicillin-binding protein 2 [Patescibacteria group bacterium]
MTNKNPFHTDYLEGKTIDRDSNEVMENWDEALMTGRQDAQEVRTINPLFDYGKIKIFAAIILSVFIVLLLRLIQLQVFAGDEYKQAAAENRFRVNIKKTVRGIIYDSDKNILVRNEPSFDLLVIPADLPKEEKQRQEVLGKVKLHLAIGEDEFSEVENNLDYSSYTPVPIKRNLERDKALFLQPRLAQWPGVDIEINTRRYYEEAAAFAHILGYVGKITEEELNELGEDDYQTTDWLGKSGLENYYESELRGQHGREQVEVDSRGKVKEVVAVSESVAGSDLILTVDRELQLKVNEIVAAELEKIQSNKAAVVVMEPDSGRVLSLVSTPDYNNNIFTGGVLSEDYERLINDEDKPLFNRVINGVYPPGSTIKPVVAAAALEERVVNEHTIIEDTGSISVPNKYNPDVVYNFVGWNLAGLGPMDIYSAIAQSSDIYFYIAGGGYESREGLGAEKLEKYYQKFGLGQATGIDLPNEKKGLIPTPDWKGETKGEEWYLGDTYHMAIGQGDVLTTPLQVACWTAAVANGGVVYQPYLVQKVVDNSSNSIKEHFPHSMKEGLVSQENIKIVQRAMRETVLSGSGKSLNYLSVSSAGKTGTAQHSGSGDNHAWYTTFAPYENPEVVVTVLVEEGGEGSEVAVPIAGKILEWYFDNKQ